MFSTIGYYICVPFAWILRTFYELTGSYGWALVLFTIVVKLITLPFQMKSKKSMMRLNASHPPLSAPYFSMASSAYCEHVGMKRQQGGR